MIMTIEQATQILDLTQDEVLFYHQCDRLPATVNQDDLTWQFEFDDLIKLKSAIEADNNTEEDEDDTE